jgi:hypothetical protein
MVRGSGHLGRRRTEAGWRRGTGTRQDGKDGRSGHRDAGGRRLGRREAAGGRLGVGSGCGRTTAGCRAGAAGAWRRGEAEQRLRATVRGGLELLELEAGVAGAAPMPAPR